jgi:hypothetical protein
MPRHRLQRAATARQEKISAPHCGTEFFSKYGALFLFCFCKEQIKDIIVLTNEE